MKFALGEAVRRTRGSSPVVLLKGFSSTMRNFAQRHFLEAACPLIQLS